MFLEAQSTMEEAHEAGAEPPAEANNKTFTPALAELLQMAPGRKAVAMLRR